MRSELTIVVTGAGAPGIRGTIYALQHNDEGVNVRIVGVDARTNVVGRYLVDSFHVVPAPEAPDYIATLADIARREHADLILPQTTREIVTLSRHKAEFVQQGVPVMVADAAAIEVSNDKGHLLGVFEEIGLPIPAYRRARTAAELRAAAGALGYPRLPVVVKPPVSNGMRGLRILRENAWDVKRFLAEKPAGTEISLAELEMILSRGNWPELLVSEYLPGEEYSVDAFRGEYASVVIPRQRRAIRSGISFDNVIEFRRDLTDYTLRAAAALGLKGAFGFQFKLDTAGAPKVLECNPRVQGTMVASLFCGVNVIWMAVRETLGEPVRSIPQPLRETLFYRFWGGIGVDGESSFEI